MVRDVDGGSYGVGEVLGWLKSLFGFFHKINLLATLIDKPTRILLFTTAEVSQKEKYHILMHIYGI